MTGIVAKLRSGLSKTRSNLVEGISKAITGKSQLDEETLETIEERLIAADIGVDTALNVIDHLRQKLNHRDRNDFDTIINLLKEDLLDRLTRVPAPAGTENGPVAPYVVMVVGVNGVGKTTTIGKLAYLYHNEGKKVIVGAADTFRAAALQQLEIWAERAGADVIRNKPGADPASVAFDTIAAAQSREADIAIIDTAGRLHTRSNLMEELKKIRRVIERRMPGAPHETLLVLDATTGQNGLVQARQFHEAIRLSGLVLTKLAVPSSLVSTRPDSRMAS